MPIKLSLSRLLGGLITFISRYHSNTFNVALWCTKCALEPINYNINPKKNYC